MRNAYLLKGCCLLLGLCTILNGCTKDTRRDPTPLDLEPSLEGQVLMLEPGNVIAIERLNVSGFSVTKTVMGPEDKTATAVVTFAYQVGAGTYRVEGVISYERTQSGQALNPRFETNSAELSG